MGARRLGGDPSLRLMRSGIFRRSSSGRCACRRRLPHDPPAPLWGPPLVLVVAVVVLGLWPGVAEPLLAAASAAAVERARAVAGTRAPWHGFGAPLVVSAVAFVIGAAMVWHYRALSGRVLAWALPFDGRRAFFSAQGPAGARGASPHRPGALGCTGALRAAARRGEPRRARARLGHGRGMATAACTDAHERPQSDLRRGRARRDRPRGALAS